MNGVNPENSPRRSKVEIVTAATAVASIGSLVGMAVTGVLTVLPVWASVLIVVAELLVPVLVFVVMKRAERNRSVPDHSPASITISVPSGTASKRSMASWFDSRTQP